jgi:hypothetical protein
MVATLRDVRQAAIRLTQQPLSFSREDFIKIVEEYVNSLPEWRRKSLLGYVREEGERAKRVVVTHEELPRKLREDPEFFQAFVRALAQLPL